ncbi:MAG: hypothetical protein KBA51_07445 [Kiritimatiellae bacterium]|nr:hypothetical protein [Kiritimatiellia bacterium]
MKAPDPFDFWYAVNHTRIVLAPSNMLETFGATVVDYHLVSEVMDAVGQVRIRQGRLHAERPEVISPHQLAHTPTEGFESEAAHRYLEWMRQHQEDLLILKYGFRLRRDGGGSEVVHGAIKEVLDRVTRHIRQGSNPMAAVVQGVDEPWEVCLVKLAADLVQRSAGRHSEELRNDPHGEQHDIEAAFAAAARDRSRMGDLAGLLRRLGRFEEYEDRFFAMVGRGAD